MRFAEASKLFADRYNTDILKPFVGASKAGGARQSLDGNLQGIPHMLR
jgi:hypothetical protein